MSTDNRSGAAPSAQKSHADIISEMRKYRDLVITGKKYADRTEAAHKRELSKICPKTGGDFGQLGDCAKLREALEAARDLLLPQCNGGTAFAKDCGKTVNKIMDALSAPPRNCDRYASAEEAWDTYDEWSESYRTKGEIPPYNEFGWLFATATATEGGNDGK